MGRKQTIDRGALLDAAERVVFREGAGQLTIDAVAAEAGVSKGGVLYAFTNKDGLIDAMFARVFSATDALADAELAKGDDTPENRIRAYTIANRDGGTNLTERTAGLIVNFMRSPQYRQGAQDYYQRLLKNLDLTTDRGRRARLALLASEGVFMLRGMEYYPLSEEDWIEIHNDIMTILLGEPQR